MRALVAAIVAALLAAACSTDSDLSVTTSPTDTTSDEVAPPADPEPPADEPTPSPDEPAAPEEPAGPPSIAVDAPELLGAGFGSDAETAIGILTGVLGPPTDDTGWGEGCPLDGVDERFVSWGGLGAQFEISQAGDEVFVRWTYRLDFATGAAIPGGPTPDQIVLPDGIAMGDPFSSAAAAYGFDPSVDEIFGIAIYSGNTFTLLTSEPSVDAPITEVYAPIVRFCE